MDKSSSRANESRGQVDGSTVLNTCETVAMGDCDGTGAKSDAGDVRHDGVRPDGHASQSDVSSGHRDVPDTCNSVNTTADTTETISIHQNVPQMQNLPVNAGRCDKVESRSHAGMPNMQVDTHGIAIHVNTAGDMQKRVSTREYGWRHAETRQYTHRGHETTRLTYWEHNTAPRRNG